MFTGIIGHKIVLDYLRGLVQSDRRFHAYLFIGKRGVGKTTVARAWAHAILGSPLVSSPDYQEVLPENGHISIETVRSINAFVSQKPFAASCKVVVIKDAHTLQAAGSDALLKTLEEPRGDRLLILTAEHPDLLPQTVISRVALVPFGLVSERDIAQYLEREFQDCSAQQRDVAAALCAGRPGRASAALKDIEQTEYVATLQASLEAAFDQSSSVRLSWVAQQFSDVGKDTARKRACAQAIVESVEYVLHERTRSGKAVAERALAHIMAARRQLEHNVSPQHAIEGLLLSL